MPIPAGSIGHQDKTLKLRMICKVSRKNRREDDNQKKYNLVGFIE